MLPSFYQTCLQSQLTQTQFVTLEILVELLHKERRITIERLATLFPQPILFESRRRNIQRFLSLPQLTPQAIWFPIVKQWVKRHHPRSKPLHLVIDRTQWQDHNLIMVSLVYNKRAIPLHWMWLNKQGQSSLVEQRRVLRPVFHLLKKHRFILLGDREFHSIELAAWCVEKRVKFVFRLPKSTTVKPDDSSRFTRLDDLPQTPGITEQYLQIQVTQNRGFGKHNLVLRQKRAYRQSSSDAWYLLTNLVDAEQTLNAYATRFSIEPLFKDYKSGGYHLEDCHADFGRFTALLVLIAIAYSISTLQGRRIRKKQVQRYVARVTEPKRTTKRHSAFWIGLYGKLWIEPLNLWSTLAGQLMALKPQKRLFFQRGLNAISLIQSAL
ncbi:IS4 family transposase [Leptolyngbya sp. NIES-2104]|uniref:IS4 family transposase n=1 Tax=Leptolyngbya sp. NIES-2104 TaxID=1552121 RepID=UPI0006EC4C9F|nr:IS4 family transposase [Leptolyngbya sp. NIES-2104]GAP94313.1 enolase [Leptolyngbya sp. NIES-2104]GAP95021.1 enolase [Leptolyngbya sp. NIES-2104]GAP95946.1 enolase [Leptolyngbya sp. NIES-2104]GAP95954.1 enolase [Leptolyngbya sp. NIES-2104]GAP96624.1 enolase [Leptolyngbya sp. NIES-2104]